MRISRPTGDTGGAEPAVQAALAAYADGTGSEHAALTALANGEPPPLPHEDPDIRAEIQAVTSGFTLEPGGRDADLTVILATRDMAEARETASQIAMRLAPRLRRGIEIRTSLSRTYATDSHPPHFSHTGPAVPFRGLHV